jgi:subtilisin-like proprotein convertase family protein
MMYRSSSPRACDRVRARRLRFFRPALEALEDRTTPTGVGWAVDADPVNGGYGLGLDAQANSYVAGTFSGTAIFGSTTLTSAGGNDGYVAKYAPDGSLGWATRFGGTGSEAPRTIATDAGGNTYVVGNCPPGTVTFGAFSLTSGGAFLAKLDPVGNFTWARQFGGDGYAFGVAVDGSGNVFASGRFSGTGSFGSGLTLTSVGFQDAFVVKLDSSGNTLWARRMGGGGTSTTGADNAEGMSTDPNGNVYVTGCFTGTGTFGSTSLTSTVGQDVFVARLDSLGNFQWAQRMGGDIDGTEIGIGTAVDSRSADPSTWAVYVTGDVTGNNVDFGSTTFAAPNTDTFVAKLNAATGSFTWADHFSGSTLGTGYGIALDGAGNVYSTGRIYGTTDFDPAAGTFVLTTDNFSAFVSKLDPNGNFLAAWQAVGNSVGGAIAADTAGDVWVFGSLFDTTTVPTGQTFAGPNQFVMRMNNPNAAVLGSLYADLNNNGVRDPSESPLAGWNIYADLNSNGIRDPGEPFATTNSYGRYQIGGLAPGTYTIRVALLSGWTATAPSGGTITVTVGNGSAPNNNFAAYTPMSVMTYTNTKATMIKGDTTTLSTVSVADSYTVFDINVKVNISFSPDSALWMSLVAPDGTQVPLTERNGGSGANFTNTIFDDEVSTSISSGSAPFSGSYRPVGSLITMRGKNVHGTWTLSIFDSSRTAKGTLNNWSLTVTHATNAPISPQLAAGGVAPGGESAAPALTPAQLSPISHEAIVHWAATGLTAPQLALLNQVQYTIQDLSASGALGLTALGTTQVLLDATADGWGWFIDATPADNAEFTVAAGGQELQALPGSPAFGRMDLLTVVEHELGHVLGLDDIDPGLAAHDLMTTTLGLGTRRLPADVLPASLVGRPVDQGLALKVAPTVASGNRPLKSGLQSEATRAWAAVVALLATQEPGLPPIAEPARPFSSAWATDLMRPAALEAGSSERHDAPGQGIAWSPSAARYSVAADRFFSADDLLRDALAGAAWGLSL